ncbi:MAG: Outer-membrane lipoprotein carrier protein [Paracidovorax wautersii]|uniref:Outer-membrane lipoprotein carrier protein n=1 Tax=Paracidovorax wautersii TaxID=1177982 RepID=A0A7V8JRP2_9BURK|nr:MAG: Outer-membrane lipoprotein carrier protein [Paracidovorax wautersii]
MRRRTALAGLAAGAAWAGLSPVAAATFDLVALQALLQVQAVSRGEFVQEKYLRGMAQPMTSQGHFVLAQGQGLLWQLRSPLQQDYRITPQGIARRQGAVWQSLASQGASAQQNRLFLAVLAGDSDGLAEQFELQLTGTERGWLLVLKPRSALLRQVFDDIRIEGGATVSRIELREAQGDRSVIRLRTTGQADRLNADEQEAFAHA